MTKFADLGQEQMNEFRIFKELRVNKSVSAAKAIIFTARLIYVFLPKLF